MTLIFMISLGPCDGTQMTLIFMISLICAYHKNQRHLRSTFQNDQFITLNCLKSIMELNKLPKVKVETARDFFSSLPRMVQPEWLKDVDTNFHFDIQGETGGLFSVVVKNNNMDIHPHLDGQPKCTIKAKEIHFMQLLRGELNPIMALLTGKLKVSDQEEVAKHARLFGFI